MQYIKKHGNEGTASKNRFPGFQRFRMGEEITFVGNFFQIAIRVPELFWKLEAVKKP